MHISFLFTLALPLLAALARPLPRGQPESFDLDLRADPLDVDTLDLRSLSLRELEDFEDLLEVRALKGKGGPSSKTPPKRNSPPPKRATPKTPVPVATRPQLSKKITRSQQETRKNEVKAKLETQPKEKGGTTRQSCRAQEDQP